MPAARRNRSARREAWPPIHAENEMPSSSRWRLRSKCLLLVSTMLAAATLLAACQDERQSLADYIAALCATPFRSASPDEAQFLAENVSAMTKMMIDMGIKPSGDVDKDFVAMMTPHHQGAIEMALAVLRHGRNPQIRRLAQEIIITQQQEIAVMRLAIGEPLPSSLPPPAQASRQR
jgi:uncharacterized protein (DUF305 family)